MNKNNQIRVYEDKELSHLMIAVMNALEQEELNFLLSNMEVDENGRTIFDVKEDKIKALKQVNVILRDRYKNNTVADSEIVMNDFIISHLQDYVGLRPKL